jgi:hypothetical protein
MIGRRQEAVTFSLLLHVLLLWGLVLVPAAGLIDQLITVCHHLLQLIMFIMFCFLHLLCDLRGSTLANP